MIKLVLVQTLKKYQDQFICSYGYKLMCWWRYSKPYKNYFGEDATKNVLNDMIKESEYCYKEI